MATASHERRSPHPFPGTAALRGAERHVAPALHATPSRRLFYRLWGLLPSRLQHTLMRLGSPKVTLGACAVICDVQGRVLLVHHTYRRAWGLPGGLASADEQPAKTLARELREELGAIATIGPLLHAEVCTSTGHLTLYYQVSLTGTPRADGVEIDAYRYVNPDEVPALLDTPDVPWLTAVRGCRCLKDIKTERVGW